MARPNRYTSKAARQMGYASGFEARTADQLEKDERAYEYESETCEFEYHKTISRGAVLDEDGEKVVIGSEKWKVVQWHTYTCDFCIKTSKGENLFIETKGYFKPQDRAKHVLVRKQHPEADIRIIFTQDGKVSVKTRYSQWCEKNNIKYHIVTPSNLKEGNIIPQGWLEE